MDAPPTRYAKSGDLLIAYQVFGSGALDLVFIQGYISNLDLCWEEPGWAYFLSRLAGFSRLIVFDKRGTGLSDRIAGVPHLEERMDDLRAVMDAAGSRRAALFGFSEGGPMSLLFAASYPERVRAIGIYGGFARGRGLSEDLLQQRIPYLERVWGTGEVARNFAPNKARDPAYFRHLARWERLGASPSAAIALMRMNNAINVEHILPAVSVPTLIMHRTDDEHLPIENGRELAAKIPGAKFLELPPGDHSFIGERETTDQIVDALEEFLTGKHSEPDPDRVLATVLFTDIVDSTKRATDLGDRDWRILLARHNEAVRQELARFRGREIKTMGDGFLATFDGPARGVRCATSIIEKLKPLGIEVRCGLHTGEIEMGRDDVGGIAVNTAARVADLAGAGEVLVSSTVRDLVAGSGLQFCERGSHRLRGLPDELRLFAA
jgi:class 3 adenylate cyclase